MSKYQILRESYGHASAEEKLNILRHEMIMPISAIRGYAALMKKKIDSDAIEELPKDFSSWVEKIAIAGDDLYEVLEALTKQ